MSINIRAIIRDVRARIFFILCLVWFVAAWREQTIEAFIFPLVSTLIFAILDLTYTYIFKKKWYYPFSSLVSGMLIGLLIHPEEGILGIISAVFFAFISKHFIKYKGSHIFNPAAFGLVIASLLFGYQISWWAVAPGGISLIIIASVVYTLYKLKRLQLPIVFLLGYFFYFLLTSGLQTAVSLTLDGTVFLFSFIMLPEPMSSTINGWWRFGFAGVALSVLIVISALSFSFTDPLLLSLLISNLLGKVFSRSN